MRIALFLLLISHSAISAHFIDLNNYKDPDCQYWNLSRFKQVEQWFTVGVKGASKKGFSYEVPISREGVDVLWCSVQPDRGKSNSTCLGKIDFYHKKPFHQYSGKPAQFSKLGFKDLEQQYEIYKKYILKILKSENIDHPNVGAILEILARYYFQDMTSIFPSEIYSIYGGVSYRWKKSGNTLGELDVIVFEKSTCDVIAIGEAKASSPGNLSGSLKKAKGQLQRFKDFLDHEL